MGDAQTILVVILSAALAVFLILNIIFLVIAIKIANHIKRISAKAELITDRAETVADFMSKAATPMAIGKIIANVSDAIFSRNKSSRRK